jgi:glutathione S-transferase
MFDLHYWPTPNGHKITLMLEECGLDYRIVPVDIGSGAQFEPDFLKIAPNNRMPAIVDHAPADGGAPLSLFESGAILQYLAEKTGRFLPADLRGRYEVLQWLFWQMAGLGPMLGQNHHFNVYAPEKIPYAIERYVRETARLYGVLDRALPTAPSSPATTASPTWPAIRGSCRMSVRACGWPTSRICSAGSSRSRPGRQRSLPMPKASPGSAAAR